MPEHNNPAGSIPSSIGFTLFITQDDMEGLAFLADMYQQMRHVLLVAHPSHMPVDQEIMKFIKLLDKKAHEMNWCDEPDCKYGDNHGNTPIA